MGIVTLEWGPNRPLTIREVVILLERLWNVRPHAVLACAEYSDEHWQIFHPGDLVHAEPMPRYTLTNGVFEQHP
jgi:hypothetical protein